MSNRNKRIERDSLGEMAVPDDVYWGSQTQRSCQYFDIGDETMPWPVINALVLIKKVAARVNHRLGLISEPVMQWIDTVTDELLQGQWSTHFPLKVWQTGSGTQTNMNVNEVIANRAIALAGGILGSKQPVHPNDHVNCSQSSNDVFPTAMHIATALAVHRQLQPALAHMKATLSKKIEAFKGLIKVGRTHCQDAVPLTVDQEFSAFLSQLEAVSKQIEHSLEPIYELALGGTAVGTGLNTDPVFAQEAVSLLADLTGLPFKKAPNLFAALACHDPMVCFSGTLKTLACALMKMANDIRFLGSGPRCGLGELQLPENEPGSSIMPGKVNPTQSEALTMVCAQVIGNDVTIGLAGSQGHFQLNVFKPVIVYNLLQSIHLLSDAMRAFSNHCLEGLQVNRAQLETNLEQSLMLVTALNPIIGYDKAANIARKAYRDKISLKQAAIESGFLTEAEFEAAVQPAHMLGPVSQPR